MSKAKVFAINQVLEKSLEGYRPSFRYGERVEMYNNVYKVLHCQDKGYTILEDSKNSKVAFPTNKLRLMMKNDLCRNLGSINIGGTSYQPSFSIEKAVQISGPSQKVGVTHAAANAAYSKNPASPSSSQARGEPVGTVTNGRDGETYKKISSNPAVWVKVATGSVHHEAGGEEQDPMSVSQESRHQFQGMMSKIESKVHPEDRPQIQKKAEEWVKENAKFKHMQAAHNTNEVDDKGRKMPKTGIAASSMQQVYSQGDKARKVRQELIDMVKESHSKLKGTQSGKQ